MLLSSRAALQRAGFFQEYERHLASDYRTSLREVVAGIWLPVGYVVAHYSACDALGLSASQQQSLGKSNAEYMRGTLLGTVSTIARAAGTTPLTMLEQIPRFWHRVYDGGGITIERTGPKDAQVRVSGYPVLRSEYCRHGLIGPAEMMLGLVASRVYIRVLKHDAQAGWVVYLGQWV